MIRGSPDIQELDNSNATQRWQLKYHHDGHYFGAERVLLEMELKWAFVIVNSFKALYANSVLE